ncbi:MAG: GcrA family cell cycle regulator, partial [Zavarzinia sp.]|nr:GcrA family cell cycle regulator [Zavarzinia sp.]
MSWTDERIATLRDLWEQGLSASQIAARLGNITRNAVIGKVHRLGLSGRPSPVRAERPATAAPAPKPAEAPAPRVLAAVPAAPRHRLVGSAPEPQAAAPAKPRILPASP